MKKILFSIAVLFVFLASVWSQKADEVKLSYREEGSILPPFRVIDTLRKEYTQDDFKSKGNHFFLFMFNPTCGHCMEMAILMRDNIDYFKENKILFLSGPQMMPYLNSFYHATKINEAPQIVVGIDSAKTIDALYSYKTLPQINIYDKKDRLVKIFYGDTPLDSLKKYVP